ncbi:YadA-like family protein [Burkholderia cenocepacia]|uniref:YadA-like family protein n=1 Tax=Burkholderia cenocepacia TaxID=95486 RepID=UPI002864B9DA|nr:YadA-like family protein [Burkholderia cenocepacia]MDR8038646.1 YadA-like family protein [Burkholderia cenocepacia]
MNKTYRTVWNATTGTWAAAPETARMRTKSKANSTMKSSVTAAVAVMAGVGGGTMSVDAMAQAANGGGSLSLCAPSGSGLTGMNFGGGNTVGTRQTAACGAAISNFRLSEGHVRSFQLYNNSNVNGSGVGQASAATEAGISGTVDGHLFLLGGSGVHLRGPVDFDSNASMTNHRITNLANGTAGTDAVNLNQLNAAVATAGNPYVAVSTGNYATATAAVATAGNSATAVGGNARATGVSAVAIGGNTVASNQNATAIGTLSRATGSESVAVGTSANAAGANASAFGQGAGASANRATAAGSGAAATGDGATALGYTASAVGANAIAVGRGASTSGTYGTAIGYQAQGATNAVGMGVLANASGDASVALGNRASSAGASAVAVGSGAQAAGANAVALGAGSSADRDNSVSVGSAARQRQIANVAAGTEATDAVNFGQMNAALATKADNTYFKVNSTAAAANAGTANSIAIGPNATVNAGGVGGANSSIAIGNGAVAGGTDTIMIGTSASHSGSGATVVGSQASAGGGGAGVALGYNSSAAGNASVSLGTSALANGRNSVALGTGSVADVANTVSVGSTDVQRRITNMAAGTAATDAVNVSQLTGVTNALGGGASVGADGSITQPTYTVAGKDYRNVGDALDAIAANGGDPDSVKYDDAMHQAVTLGNAGTPVAIHNVAEGALTATSTDAVNGSQLFATNTRVGDLEDSLAKGGLIDPVTGESLAVVYDGTAKDTVTLKGADGTTLANVKAGVADMDAVNVSQLKGSGLIGDDGKSIAAVTYDRNADGTINRDKVTLQGADGTTLSNVKAGVAEMDAVNVGQMNTALSTKLDNKLVKVDGDVAASTVGERSIAIGSGASADNRNDPSGIGIGSIAVGDQAQADGANSVAVGAHAYANTIGSAFGTMASASGAGASAIGYGTDASGRFASAIGSLASASGENSVALGANSVADRDNTVSVGSGTQQRQIVNVAAGTQDTDAVNVGQLRDSGLIGDDGKPIAAVTYDRNTDGMPNYGTVTLGNGAGPTQIKNVADATDDHDALNLGQLKGAGLVGDDGSGNLTSLAVTYDSAAKDAVTLGGAGATTPVALKNVADGVDRHDAINLGQLQDAGLVAPVDPTNPGAGLTSLAVTYDGVAKDKVTLQGAYGTTLSNVKAGVADMDAVNVSQLKDAGLIGDDGKSIAAVTYDRNPDGTPNYGTVTLGNGAGPTQIKNVAAGVDGTDAVNVNQMNALEERMQGADLRFVKVNADPVTGTPALATGALAVAIGSGAQAAGANSLALGSGARVSGANSVAIGYNSIANQNNVVSVGSVGNERRIVNVADGDVSFQSTDAVNGGQLYAALNDLSTSVNSKTQQAIDTFSSAIDEKTKAAISEMNTQSMQPMDVTDPLVAVEGLRGDNLASLNGADPATATAVAIGTSSAASGGNAVAIGVQNVAGSDNSVALGSFAQTGAGQPYSVAMGSNVQTNGTQAVAMGANAQANADYALAIGNNNVQAIGDSSIALGNGANVRAGATNSIAMGAGANVARNVQGAMALGSGATATTNGGIALGDNALANRANALSIGRAGAERQIVNVAAGTQNTDAVNVGQLKGVTNALGGGAGVGADGSVTQPTYSVGGKDYNNVGDALDAIAASGGDPDAVKYDDDTHQAVTLGNAGTPVTIHNVAEGALTATSTDAVNGSQLFATNTRVGDLEGSLKDGGVIDPVTGKSLAVVYDGTEQDKVTLKGADGTTLANVKAGVADMDAVNVSQLKGSGLIGDDGKSIAAVTYDRNADGTANYGSVTFGGGHTTDPVVLSNVAQGVAGTDAVNVDQLTKAIKDVEGGTNPLAVSYDTVAQNSVTLKGADGTTLANVKAGVADMDAVNVSQLKGSGLIGDDGKSIAAVTYDRNADGTPNYGKVTLGNGEGPTQLKNVADATDDGDALNLGQLKNAGLVGEDDKGNLTSAAVTYDQNADGTINHDQITLKGTDGTTLSNVKAGVADMDAVNVSQLKDSGLIGDDGKSIAAVTYDDATKISVTLGNAGTPVTIHNVAAGALSETSTDAVNGSQLFATNTRVGDLEDSLKDGGVIDPVTGKSLAVVYDGTEQDKVTLKGADGTTLANVKAGVADMDAVNVSQLKGSGLIGDDGKTIAAVTYDRNADGTPNYGTVTLGNGEGPTQLKNVANATDDGDALNLGQLKEAGLIGDDDKGNLTSAAVTYDRNADGTINHDQITLQGADGTTITNVKAGALSETSTDAVNGSQLFATNTRVDDLEDSLGKGGVIDPVTGESLAVVYDGTAKGTVTLKGADGTTLANVKAGVADMDAVNVSQLKGSGLIGDDGKAIAAVTYDRLADGTPNYGAVTLGHGAGPTQLKNVAAATDNTDAVNFGQMKDYVGDQLGNPGIPGNPLAVAYDDASKGQVTLAGGADGTTITNVKAGEVSATSTDTINGAQLHGTAQSVADALGGGSTVGADGKVTNPTYSLADPTDGSKQVGYNNVGDALSNLDGRTSTNTENITVINKQLADSGLVDPVTGQSIAAVTYDRNADGTPNLGSVTLGGAGATAPVALKNVADGTDRHDAINLGQLQDAGLVAPVDPSNPGAGLKSLAVTYDGVDQDKATLKGADGTTLANVKAGVADMDAVNVSQLKGSGLIGDDGKAIAAVTYDRNADGTPDYGKVTLGHGEGPTQLKNVANATDDGDALNLGQLKEAGLVGDDGSGNLTSLAVTYDNAAKDAITLGNAGTPVAIHNVADGVLSATSKDAVNGSQLFATNTRVGDLENSLKDGGVIDPITGRSLAVTYDGVAKDTVTLQGADGTTLANVKAGVADMDAVNVSQLKGSGLIGDDGKSIAAVTYDRNADGTPNLGSVTLGGAGATTPVALKNVADGVDRHDAINLGQLQDAGLVAPVDPTNPGAGLTSTAVTYDKNADDSVNFGQITLKGGADGTKLSNVAAGEVSATSKDAVNGAQLHGTAQSVADSLGGGSTVGADGKVTNPTYSLADPADGSTKTEYHNVGDALANLDGRTSTNTENITVINKQLGDSGLVDPVTGQTLAAVTYDRNADGTPNRGSVTLGGADATTPVALKNVADGVEAHDAVNVGQLQAAGIVAPVDPENPGKGLKSLAVTYDGVDQDKVTLKGADGTTLTNVKAGEVTATSTDAINGAQLHATAQSVSDSLGGGSTVDADGKVTSPTYSLADPTNGSTKTEYHNVGDALANLDGRTSTNTENITVINKQLADTGLVDPSTGQTLAAVTYDRNADGTPNRGSVTLGGADATAPVALKNVADGTDRHDAINLGQLQDAGLVAPVDPANPGTGLTSLAVTYDKHADGSANFDQISLKGENGTTITNVKAGAVSATSTDAVNGSQLYGASQSVAKALGGGATVDANGNVTNPTYTVNNEKFDNVGDALDNISSSLVHGSIGLVQQDETTRDITVAKNTDGTTVNFAGTAGDRVLTGVGAGVVSATSNDAINGSQLHGTAQSVADTIGGGTTVDADGKLADTSIEVNGSKYKTVAEAVQAAAAYGATDSLAVRYDLNGDGTPNFGSVTLGGTGAAPVRLTNVANGTTQYDAVNFGQLSELSDRIGGVDERVGRLEQNPGGGGGTPPGGGSGSDYFAGTDIGTGTTPANAGTGVGNTAAGSGAVVGDGVNNGTAIGSSSNVSASNGVAIGSSAKSSAEGATAIGSNANASGSKSAAIGDGASASGSNSVALGAGSVATSDNTVSVGSATQQRTISNLADGVNASDAATKGQMDRAIGGVQGQVNELARNAYSGIAAATALTMIPGVDPGKTLSFGIGGATFQGYQAVAFGGEARITQNLKMKAGVGLSSGGNTVGVGASYQW